MARDGRWSPAGVVLVAAGLGGLFWLTAEVLFLAFAGILPGGCDAGRSGRGHCSLWQTWRKATRRSKFMWGFRNFDLALGDQGANTISEWPMARPDFDRACVRLLPAAYPVLTRPGWGCAAPESKSR